MKCKDPEDDKIYEYININVALDKVHELFHKKLLLNDEGTITCSNGVIRVNEPSYNLFVRDARDIINEFITNYLIVKNLYEDFCENDGINIVVTNEKGEQFIDKDTKKIKDLFCIRTIFKRYVEQYLAIQGNRIKSFLMNTEIFIDGLHNINLDEVELDVNKDPDSLLNRLRCYEKQLLGFQIDNSYLKNDNKESIMEMIDKIRANIFENDKYNFDVIQQMYPKIVNILKTIYEISLNENKMLCEFIQYSSKSFIEREIKYTSKLFTLPVFILEIYKYFGNIYVLAHDFCRKSEMLRVYDPNEDLDPYGCDYSILD